jgi:hypothetical protein
VSDSKKTIKVDITVDLKYVNWSNPAQPTGQIEWTVAPTLLIIPTDDCTSPFLHIFLSILVKLMLVCLHQIIQQTDPKL